MREINDDTIWWHKQNLCNKAEQIDKIIKLLFFEG